MGYYDEHKPLLGLAEKFKADQLPTLDAGITEALAQAPKESHPDALNSAKTLLQGAQTDVAAAHPDAAAEVAANHTRLIQERADIANRGLTTGERIAMAVLGAAPAALAAASRHGNVPAAVEAGNKSVQTLAALSKQDQETQLGQKDVELKYNEKDSEGIDHKAEKQAERDWADKHQRNLFDQQDKLDAKRYSRDEAGDIKKVASRDRSDQVTLAKQLTSSRALPAQFQTAIARADRAIGVLDGVTEKYTKGAYKSILDVKDPVLLNEILNNTGRIPRTEFGTAMAALINQGGAATVEGIRTNTAQTWGSNLSNVFELAGEGPISSGAARQLSLQLDTAKRERQISKDYYNRQLDTYRSGFGHLLRSPDPLVRKDAETLLQPFREQADMPTSTKQAEEHPALKGIDEAKQKSLYEDAKKKGLFQQ